MAQVKPRFKDRMMQNIYDTMLALAEDSTSELYLRGIPRRGAAHRCAFWDGYDGLTRSASAVPGTLSMACFRAGQEWAKRVQRIAKGDSLCRK